MYTLYVLSQYPSKTSSQATRSRILVHSPFRSLSFRGPTLLSGAQAVYKKNTKRKRRIICRFFLHHLRLRGKSHWLFVVAFFPKVRAKSLLQIAACWDCQGVAFVHVRKKPTPEYGCSLSRLLGCCFSTCEEKVTSRIWPYSVGIVRVLFFYMRAKSLLQTESSLSEVLGCCFVTCGENATYIIWQQTVKYFRMSFFSPRTGKTPSLE